MQTLKIKYSVSDEELLLIKEYQRQYSHTLRFAYNRAKENNTDKYVEPLVKQMNNINLLDSFFIRSAVKEAEGMVKTGQDKIIFGGKKNFINRCQGKITKEEFDLHEKFKDLVEVYYFLKKSKCRYRLSLEKLNLRFSSCFSDKSMVTFCYL